MSQEAASNRRAAPHAFMEAVNPCAKRRRVSHPGEQPGGAGAGPANGTSPCRPTMASPQHRPRPGDDRGGLAATTTALASLAGGPYFTVAACLEARDLCRMDAAGRLLRTLNGLPAGPWFLAGDRAFHGMELDVGGGFLPYKQEHGDGKATVAGATGWKARYDLFRRHVPTFSPPFGGAEILSVEHPDEVAYCRCRLRRDLLEKRGGRGVYVEVEVLSNADNLSLAVVDFEGGGRSSVTFSPETGAVLRERKVRESPRAIEGTYIHLLPAAPPGRRFEGKVGLYLSGGHLAFFRRWSSEVSESAPAGSLSTPGRWETTGYCTDLAWAQGPRLSMCLAFRDDGPYRVRVARVGRVPPEEPQRSREAYEERRWSLLYGDDDHPLAI